MGNNIYKPHVFNPGDCQLLPGIEVRYYNEKKNKWYRACKKKFKSNLEFLFWVIDCFVPSIKYNTKNPRFYIFYLDDDSEDDKECNLPDLNWRTVYLHKNFDINRDTYMITDKNDIKIQVEVRGYEN